MTEVQTEKLGRPDMGVAVKGLLAGHVELKAPGKGADPGGFKDGADKKQWEERFKNLPNLIYTDGNEWALYRTGDRVGKIVRLSGQVETGGQTAIGPGDAEAVLGLVFVEPKVITLDPGAGTGTYILAALQHGLDRVEQAKGPGMRASFATQAVQNLYAFELLVGPYAVATLEQLRRLVLLCHKLIAKTYKLCLCWMPGKCTLTQYRGQVSGVCGEAVHRVGSCRQGGTFSGILYGPVVAC